MKEEYFECECGCSIVKFDVCNIDEIKHSSVEIAVFTSVFDQKTLWNRIKIAWRLLTNGYYGEHWTSLEARDWGRFVKYVNKVKIKYPKAI